MVARKLLVALFALAPVVAVAQWPNDAPPPPPEEEGSRPPRQFGRFAPPSEQEIEDAKVFMKENAPNRWQAVETLPEEDGSTLRRNVMGFVIARYRMLQGIKEDDPRLYETKVQQLRVEDELYGLLSDADTPEKRAELREPLTKASRKLVELSMDERAKRIERLKGIVVREEQNLVADQSQIDVQVKSRVEALITEGQAGLRKDMGGGGRREHRRERPTTQPSAPR